MRAHRIPTSRSHAHRRLWRSRSGWCRRHGSIYIIVLISSALVAAVGLSIIALSRVQFRASAGRNDAAEADILAYSAVQHALGFINTVPNWYEIYHSGVEVPPLPLGRGTFSWTLTDLEDGSLGNGPPGLVRLVGIGRVGDAVRACGATLSGCDPLEALNTCLHAGNMVYVKPGKLITVVGAPLSTNGDLRNEGTVKGDVEAATMSIRGIITGKVTVPAPPKGMPPLSVIDLYRSKATPISTYPEIQHKVLSPGENPWGLTNPDGVYYISTGGSDLLIKSSRIHGTLVVRCKPGRVILDDCVLLHNYRPDYPVLVVDGKVEMRMDSAFRNLDENYVGNMNPPGSPYEGESDYDTIDQYPNEVRGLVHCTETFRMMQTARVVGVVICETTAEIEEFNQIIHDPNIYHSPPEGYAASQGTMVILPDTWSMEPVPSYPASQTYGR